MGSSVFILVPLYFVQFCLSWEAMLPFCGSKSNNLHDLCCPGNCTNGTAKNHECIAQCPDNMHIIEKSCLNSHDEFLSDFTCISTCPVDYYGVLLNNTKVCVECSLLCQTRYFKAICVCKNQEKSTNCKLYEILAVVIGTISAFLFTVLILIVGYKSRKKSRADKSLLQPAYQEKDLQQDEFKITTETDLQPDTNKIETVTGHVTFSKIAKEAQTKLDEKSRYVKDPTISINASHQKTTKSSIRQSHAYANQSTIQLHRNFVNRISNAFLSKIWRKSSSTISDDNAKCLSNDILSTSSNDYIVDQAVNNSIIGENCSGNVKVSIECHVMSEASKSVALSTDTRLDRTNDKDVVMNVGTKTPKTVQDIKSRNILCKEKVGIKNTTMKGTKFRKKKRAPHKTNEKQKFTEQNDTNSACYNKTKFIEEHLYKNYADLKRKVIDIDESDNKLPGASSINTIGSSFSPRISNNDDSIYETPSTCLSSNRKINEQELSSEAATILAANTFVERNNDMEAEIHADREASEAIKNVKMKNSLVSRNAGVEKTKNEENIYENAAFPQCKVVDKSDSDNGLPVVPSNTSIGSSSSSNSQRISSDDSSIYDTACESPSSERKLNVEKFRTNCGDTAFVNIQRCNPAKKYDLSEVSPESTINYSKIEGEVNIFNSEVTIVHKKGKGKSKRN